MLNIEEEYTKTIYKQKKIVQKKKRHIHFFPGIIFCEKENSNPKNEENENKR